MMYRIALWNRTVSKEVSSNWQLYLLLVLPVAYILVFHYYPMYGLQIAFKKYNLVKGISGSPWLGFDHFERFFTAYDFSIVLKNTVQIGFYQLIAAFPAPIILALSLNYIRMRKIKKFVQMVTYAPYFISVVVIVGIIVQLLSPQGGIIHHFIKLFTGQSINMMAEPAYFKTVYVLSGIWQTVGWGSIIYIAALTAVDPSLHEAAVMDGASKLRRIRHIDIPGILPTTVILFILEIGKFMNVGFQKILLMQNSLNTRASEVIDTYVYKVGIISGLPDFSYATAIGLFKSVIGLILIFAANQIARKVNDTSLW